MPEKTQKKLLEEQIILSRERTVLSKERTILSFIQTGLAFIGVGIVIVNMINNYPAQVIGWALILIGFVEVLESFKRLRKYMKLMDSLKSKMGKVF